jgi:hypothetical protein
VLWNCISVHHSIYVGVVAMTAGNMLQHRPPGRSSLCTSDEALVAVFGSRLYSQRCSGSSVDKCCQAGRLRKCEQNLPRVGGRCIGQLNDDKLNCCRCQWLVGLKLGCEGARCCLLCQLLVAPTLSVMSNTIPDKVHPFKGPAHEGGVTRSVPESGHSADMAVSVLSSSIRHNSGYLKYPLGSW